MHGSQLIEENVIVEMPDGRPVHALAAEDRRPFKAPGLLRYYIDGHSHATYAITGAYRDALPIQESSTGKGPNYLLHN